MPKKTVCSNCSYNAMRELVELNKLLWSLDTYIKDAKKDKHKELVKALENLKKDTTKNAKNLKTVLTKMAKQNKL